MRLQCRQFRAISPLKGVPLLIALRYIYNFNKTNNYYVRANAAVPTHTHTGVTDISGKTILVSLLDV